MRQRYRRVTIVLAIGLVAGAGSGAAIGMLAGSAGPAVASVSPGRMPTARTEVLLQGVPGSLANNFAVLSQPEGDAVPAQVEAFEGAPGLGIDPNDATYASAADSWVVPGSDGVCLVNIGVVGTGVVSGVCQSTSMALSGRLVASNTTPSGTIVVSGLEPNDVTAVVITDADGSTQTVPVDDNVFRVAGGQPDAIAQVTAAGAQASVSLDGERSAGS